MPTTTGFWTHGQPSGTVLLLAALLSSGCIYSKQQVDEARQQGYDDGFRAGFAKTRSVRIEVAGYANCEEGEDQVYINESCEVEVSGEDAEAACEW
jgi:hypothetical protein